MQRLYSAKLLLPGIFLFILGIGNVIVGHYKSQEYERVLSELAPSVPPRAILNVPPMQRMQMERERATRLDERRSKAQARRDFYQLVSFGGKGFMGLSALLIGCGICMHQFQRRQKPAKSLPQQN
jgi:hypothetical protein